MLGVFFFISHLFFGNLTAKAGLRATFRSGQAVHTGYITDITPERSLLLMPSVHLTYHTPSFHNLSLSYTRRASSPSAIDLSPFVFYSENSFSLGNPDLRPSFTHNVEGSWSKILRRLRQRGC